jgi:hypothetical protein
VQQLGVVERTDTEEIEGARLKCKLEEQAELVHAAKTVCVCECVCECE